jgi:uncharacterized membrane protein YGL010W
VIEIATRINPISYEKPYLKRVLTFFYCVDCKLFLIILEESLQNQIRMKNITNWLDEYGESHKNETNKFIHWICVSAIFFSIVGLLYAIKLPFQFQAQQLNVAMIVTLLVVLYYVKLSPSLAVGMFIFATLCLLLAHFVEKMGISLWLFSMIVFALAWVGQFYGHKIEGKKPSFLKDLQFLMIGPAWLMSFVYKKIGIAL